MKKRNQKTIRKDTRIAKRSEVPLEFVAALLIVLLALIGFMALKTIPASTVHVHADFKVFLNGERIDFSLDKYMTKGPFELSSRVHLHDQDGNVIHVHADGVTLGEFFQSLEMQLSADCFMLDNGVRNCNQGEKTLKLVVNGKYNTEFEQYLIQDLDQILLSYGSETELNAQWQLVTNNACIFSDKCPERGSPPIESCSGDDCPA